MASIPEKVEPLFHYWKSRRDDHQMLLPDFVGQTCSWFWVEGRHGANGHGTVLCFGSAVLLSRVPGPGQPVRRVAFELVMVFHKFCSRALLYLAARRTLRLARDQVQAGK